ncbi:MAG: hypothetical protein GC191_01495 [Azospirillum sp.]|nr:hypothetical protein [Azospirillum sp.]
MKKVLTALLPALVIAAPLLMPAAAGAELARQPPVYLPVLLICPAETAGHPEQCNAENARAVYPGEQSPSVMSCAMATMGVIASTEIGVLGAGEWVKILCRSPMPVGRNVG